MTNATKNSETTLANKTLGYRNILNTPWPREAYLTRVHWYGKTTWKVDVICNGINDRYQEFKTLKDARAYYDSLGEGV